MKKSILICSFLLFHVFPLLTQTHISSYVKAEILIDAYSKKDYEIFAFGFPTSFQEFWDLFGWNSDAKTGNVLYERNVDFLEYFFSDERVLKTENLNKLVSISKSYRYEVEAPDLLSRLARILIRTYPQEIALYLEVKDDEEIVSFFRLCLYSGSDYYSSDCYKRKYNALVKALRPYSLKMESYLRSAYESFKQYL